MLVKGSPGNLDQYYGPRTIDANDTARNARLSAVVSSYGTDNVVASEGTLKYTGEIGHSPNKTKHNKMWSMLNNSWDALHSSIISFPKHSI